MAVPADTFETYDSIGIREDLADIIYNIAPTETPGINNIGRGKAKGVFHEWQIDDLDAAADTPKIEGDDATNQAITPTERTGNYCQINDKVIQISGTDLVADNAGRGVEMAYQLSKRGQEMKRDMEVTAFATNKAKAGGSSGVARDVAGALAFIRTNTNLAGDGADPATTLASGVGDGSGTRTDGTPRAFTEAMLTDVIDQIFLSGGNPSMIMCNTTQKRVITGFTGNATKYKEVDDKKIVNAVDVYVSDYGELMVVPDRFMRQRDVFVLDTDMWSVDFHRDFSTHDLAKTGDSERKQMLNEWTITSKHEGASGGIFDLS